MEFTDRTPTRYRIKEAFRILRKEYGFVARMDFSCCNTCANAEISNYCEETGRNGSPSVFFNRQSSEDAKWGDKLYLQYGLVNEDMDEDRTPDIAVGKTICNVLDQVGVEWEWDGSPKRCVAAKIDVKYPEY